MKKIVLLMCVFTFYLSGAGANVGSLKGVVTDSQTKQPLIGVNIMVINTTIGTASNEDGSYTFEKLDVGTYTIEFSYIGYNKTTRTDVIIRPGRSTFLNVELTENALELGDVVVTGGYFSEVKNKTVSAVNFSAEELRRAPGSAGDVSRIMYGLPALAKVNDTRNSLIVRGGSPVENTFYIDNIEVPNINHYPVEGASDGPIGILNVDFIEDVTLLTGGFSPEYGDRMSSIMEIKYREGNNDRIEPQLNLSFAGMGAAVEGPLSDKGNFLISFNKSYLDLIVDEEETGGAMPNYSDAQAKLTYNLNDKNKLTFLDIFSVDHINLKYDNALESDLTTVYGSTDGKMNVAGLNWQYLGGKSGYTNTSIAHTYMNYDRDYYETKSQRQIFRNTSVDQSLKLRNTNYYKIGSNSALDFGFDAQYNFTDYKLFYGEWQDHYGNINPSIVIDKNFNSLKAGFYANHTFNLAANLKLNYGFRVDHHDYTKNTSFSPRATLVYNLNPITSFTLSSGIFSQEIPNLFLVQNDAFKELDAPYSFHNILGFSRMLTETTRLTIETYHKQYHRMPVDPRQPSVFILDESTTEGIFLQHETLVSAGEAYSAGVEVMIQKKLAEDFYGMISGSYSRSRYKGYNDIWRDRVYDNIFNFNFEGGYLPDDEWEFKIRWTYAGGAPYTPFDIAQSTQLREGIWDLDRINSERLPDYHSLNLRVDKRFYFTNSNMIVYLSIWNAYSRENVAQYVWDEVKNEQGTMKQWSTLPVLGIEYEF
ncbi:MAG: collagen-binding protein [Melioribacteraceae bacterium]|nr:MAG: collagen-binding protein [Melioribacteraceae bacterium]